MLDPRALWRNPQTGVWRPLSFTRTLNAGFAKLAQARNAQKTSSMPFSAVVEPTNVCQLECPLCVTGMKVKGRKPGFMSLETAEKIADQLGPYLLDVELDNWGEAFLHPKIFELIKIFKARKAHVAISSNLSLKDFDAEAVVNSGLDLLVASVDAATEPTYLKYRRGGDFKLVLSNLQRLVQTRNKMKKRNPFVLMKFLVFPHNVHEQDAFFDLSRKLGADNVLFYPPNYPSALLRNYFQNLSPEQEAMLSRSETPGIKTCHWPWTATTINWDGSVSVCCNGNSFDPGLDLGNINATPFREIWLGGTCSQIRKVFSGIEPSIASARSCWNCYQGRRD